MCIISQLLSVASTTVDENCSAGRSLQHNYFYVGGEYVFDASSNGTIRVGQMYVEHYTPSSNHRQPYPLVFIHGKAMTGTNWLNTPNGRPGWASYFLQQGYEVYIVDQPSRGRSAWFPNGGQTVAAYPAERMQERFTATRFSTLWPQAVLHTQWPGDSEETSGRMGDSIFDAFFASTIQYVADDAVTQTMVQKAGAALLDRIGAAIILTHSQAAALGWLIADARPDLVRAIVAVEPKGPPLREAVFGNRPALPWGLTDIPLMYDPPLQSPSDLSASEVLSTNSDRASCLLQNEPARTLINLRRVPVLVEAAQASYHAFYDHCTVDFLRQAGVTVDFIRLEDVGLYGNGHMQMLEKNNLDIAVVLHRWIRKTVQTS